MKGMSDNVIVDVTQKGFRCLRCNHTWVPHDITKKPITCPLCKSPFWDKPKKKKA